jgi:hypothetical protein
MKSLDRARPGLTALFAAAVAAAWCTTAGSAVDIDPIFELEVVAAGMVAWWATLLGSDIVRASRLRQRFDVLSTAETIDGVDIRLIRGGAVEAFVIGMLRPTVFVGDASMRALERDELVAVVHHEDHHRRTHAPLRAAAVEAWLRIVGRWPGARHLLSARLAELETSADAHAMRQGVRPASIASALLKFDRVHSISPAFAGSADLRIQALLDAAAGRRLARSTPLPYEWLPVAVALAVIVGCHIGELSHLV